MTAIPLRDRAGAILAWTIVSNADAALAKHVWRYNRTHRRAYRKVRVDGRIYTLYLSRAVMGLKPGDVRQVDHINRDRLDNRRENLRVVTHAQNGQNQTPQRGGTSRFRGVTWDRARNKWAVYVCVAGSRRNLGRYDDEREAAAVASRWRAEHMPYAVEPAVA